MGSVLVVLDQCATSIKKIKIVARQFNLIEFDP